MWFSQSKLELLVKILRIGPHLLKWILSLLRRSVMSIS